MNDLQTFDQGSSYTPKSFWDKKEGKYAKWLNWGIVAGIVYAVWTFMDVILKLLENTIYAGFMIGIIVGVIFLVQDRRFRNFISVGYQLIMKKLIGTLVEIDPIGLMEISVEKMKKKLEAMSEQMAKMQGGIRETEAVVNSNKKEIDTRMREAEYAKRNKNNQQVYLKVRGAQRLQEESLTYNELLGKMKGLYATLQKMHGIAEVLIADTEDNVKVQRRKRNMLLKGYSAFRSGLSLLQGNPDEMAMFNAAQEFLNEDFETKMGEIDHFLSMSKNFMDGTDIKNGVIDEQALAMLEDWEKNGESRLLGTSKAVIMDQTQQNPGAILEPVVVPAKGNSRYNSVFDK